MELIHGFIHCVHIHAPRGKMVGRYKQHQASFPNTHTQAQTPQAICEHEQGDRASARSHGSMRCQAVFPELTSHCHPLLPDAHGRGKSQALGPTAAPF